MTDEDEDHATKLARLSAALGFEVPRIWEPISPALVEERRAARRLIEDGVCPDCYRRVGRAELDGNAELLGSTDRDEDGRIDEGAWLDEVCCSYCLATRLLPLDLLASLDEPGDLDPLGDHVDRGDLLETGSP
jgi:hypothetical protein